MNAIGLLFRAWWWRKLHPTVRIGWVAARSAPGSSDLHIVILGGLAAFWWLGRARRRSLLYSAAIPRGEEVAVRVVQRGAVAASS